MTVCIGKAKASISIYRYGNGSLVEKSDILSPEAPVVILELVDSNRVAEVFSTILLRFSIWE